MNKTANKNRVISTFITGNQTGDILVSTFNSVAHVSITPLQCMYIDKIIGIY